MHPLTKLIIGTLAVVLAGCGHKHAHKAEGEAGHSHDAASAQSFSGATHKEGTGITLLDETKKLLGIQTTEVQEMTLPRTIRFPARVFDVETDRTAAPVTQLAWGTVSTNESAALQTGMPVQFQGAARETVRGIIQKISQPLPGEVEIIAAFSAARLRPGESGEITVSVPGEKPALVVPREAVIKGTTGDLVYAVNGDAYTLMWVHTGTEANGLVEITDGLLAGDSVVTHGAMELWLVELRAVKGGQGCCPAPPKKGKG